MLGGFSAFGGSPAHPARSEALRAPTEDTVLGQVPPPRYACYFDCMSRAVIYTRASLDATGEGRSVDRQLAACRGLATARGWEVVFEESDNSISAYGEKQRPGWERVLELIESRQVDVVIAWHLDRMTRSMSDLERLIVLAEANGVGIATAVGDIDLTTDTGRMVARILAAVARAEVERKAARQRLANAQLASTGRPWTGGPRPFGYTPDQLSVVEEEAEAIRDAAVRAIDGESMRSIARGWAALGLVSSRDTGAGWTGRGVKEVLISPRYAGIRTYLGEEVGPGTWPAILDMETHLALKQLLTDPVRTLAPERRGRTASNLLSGLALCSVCKGTINASANRGTKTYTCRPHAHVVPPRAELDRAVTEGLLGLLSTPDALSRLAPVGDDEVDDARAEVDALQARLQVLGESFADGNVDPDTFNAMSRRMTERLTTAKLVLRQAGAGALLKDLNVGSADVIKQWEDLTLERKRRLIDTFLVVEVQPSDKGGRSDTRGWDADKHLVVSRR